MTHAAPGHYGPTLLALVLGNPGSHPVRIFLAAKEGLAIDGAAVVATISFSRDPMDGLFMLMADVCVHLPGVKRELTGALVRNTERFCAHAKMAREGILNVVRLASPEDELPIGRDSAAA